MGSGNCGFVVVVMLCRGESDSDGGDVWAMVFMGTCCDGCSGVDGGGRFEVESDSCGSGAGRGVRWLDLVCDGGGVLMVVLAV